MRPRCVLALFCLALPAAAQYDDDAWGLGLAEEFGFDDMAETVFKRLLAAPEPERKVRARIGLAKLKRRQAGRTDDVDAKLRLLGEAVDLLADGKAVPGARTRIVDALAERGLAALSAAAQEGLPAPRRRQLADIGNGSFSRAEKLLRAALSGEEPTYEEAPAAWRTWGAAHLRLCWLLFEWGDALKGGRKLPIKLISLPSELEDFILFAESAGEDGTFAAMHGYLLLGRVQAALFEPSAGDCFHTVVDTVLSSDPPLAPAAKELGERAMRRWVAWLVEEKKYALALSVSGDWDRRIAALGAARGVHGRWAAVHQANAHLALKRTSHALSLLTDLLEENGSDSAAREASGIIEKLASAERDPTKLKPDVLRAAARAAYAAGADRQDRALQWLTLLLGAIDRVEDEAVRERWRAEAWYDLARIHWFAGRLPEAIDAAERGTKACVGRAPEGLDRKLASLWRRAVRRLVSERPGADSTARLEACIDWLAENPETGLGSSPVYDRAVSALQRAEQHVDAGRLSDALREVDSAIDGFGRVVATGGAREERARLRQARSRLRKAEISAQRSAAKPEVIVELARQAASAYRAYLDYADAPDRPVTDPAAIDARDAGRHESRYGVARAHRLVLDRIDDDAGERRPLAQETVTLLAAFEAGSVGIRLSAFELMLRAQLELADFEGAERTFLQMRALLPDHRRTVRCARRLATALRPSAEEEFARNPGSETARARLLSVFELYVHWCVVGKQPDFESWDFVTYHLSRLEAWELSVEVARHALRQFASAPEKVRTRLQRRFVVAASLAADAAFDAGDADTTARLRHDAGQHAKLLLETRLGKDPEFVRLSARLLGGRMVKKNGILSFDPGLSDFKVAFDLWKKIERTLRATDRSGTEDWWEAKFHTFHLALLVDREAGADTSHIRKKLDTLEAVHPGLGGPKWRARFRWLRLR